MKKLTVCLTLAAFCFIPALKADDSKPAAAAKTTAEPAKASCCADSCCAKREAMIKKSDPTSKGASLLMAKR